jgi:colanic acid biosynthesis glycosyl transferase WcaI
MAYIFVNRYFHPDHSATSQMLSDLAFAFAAPTTPGDQPCTVRIITSRQCYDAPDAQLAARETIAGVDIYRVWTSRFGRINLAGRAVDYLTFYLSAAWTLWRLTRGGDVVIAKTDPPMLSIFAAPIVKLRGARLVNWLQDVFPEVAEALGVGSGRVVALGYGALRSLRNATLRMAAMNVVLGERMAEKLAALGVSPKQIRIIPNWADGTLIRPVEQAVNALRSAWGLQDRFVVGYSGNLGRAHEYATLLDAITALDQRSTDQMAGQVSWLFIGGGALFEAFKGAVQQRGLKSVVFQAYQPRERLGESLSAIDVHLISLRPELEGLIVPSKYYGIAAAGRPAIFIGDPDGEIARANTRNGCGVNVAEGDHRALAAAVMQLASAPDTCRAMGTAARRAFDAEFDKPIAVKSWQALLREVEGSREVPLVKLAGDLNAPVPD